jgi:hypothetical protein
MAKPQPPMETEFVGKGQAIGVCRVASGSRYPLKQCWTSSTAVFRETLCPQVINCTLQPSLFWIIKD